MSKYEITADVIKDIASICPDTLKVMEKHYPEVFEKKEEWTDIGKGEIEWKLGGREYHWLEGLYNDEIIVVITPDRGIILNNTSETRYNIERNDCGQFKILKKVIK